MPTTTCEHYQPKIGESVYNHRNQKIGIIEGFVSSKGEDDLYKVVAAEGYMGVGKIPYAAFTLINGKLHINSPLLA